MARGLKEQVEQCRKGTATIRMSFMIVLLCGNSVTPSCALCYICTQALYRSIQLLHGLIRSCD